MWTWINCNVLGRHKEIVTADRVSIHLLCVNCGHRTAGWQLVSRLPTHDNSRLWPQPVAQMAPRQPS